MLTLRLARAGAKKRPVYHLVATDNRKRRDGRFVENLGYFIPAKDVIVLKQDRVDYWISVGARVTSVASHLIRTAKNRPAVAVQPAKPRAGTKAALAPAKQGAEGDGQSKAAPATGSASN